jgi:hypothetical protein
VRIEVVRFVTAMRVRPGFVKDAKYPP